MALRNAQVWSRVLGALGRVSLALLIASAALATLWTLAAALGLAPWIALEGGLTGAAAMQVQIAVTVLLVALCFFVPSHVRVMRLEESHRNFAMTMDDVARAYATVHEADRHGVFSLPREFDAVRERIGYLRHHPDLGSLEPGILDLAAQMSHESHELAETYAMDRVQRAKRFLRQRREEADLFAARLEKARAACAALRAELDAVETDEAAATAARDRLERDLKELLPRLGLDVVERPSADIASLAARRPAE